MNYLVKLLLPKKYPPLSEASRVYLKKKHVHPPMHCVSILQTFSLKVIFSQCFKAERLAPLTGGMKFVTQISPLLNIQLPKDRLSYQQSEAFSSLDSKCEMIDCWFVCPGILLGQISHHLGNKIIFKLNFFKFYIHKELRFC